MSYAGSPAGKIWSTVGSTRYLSEGFSSKGSSRCSVEPRMQLCFKGAEWSAQYGQNRGATRVSPVLGRWVVAQRRVRGKVVSASDPSAQGTWLFWPTRAYWSVKEKVEVLITVTAIVYCLIACQYGYACRALYFVERTRLWGLAAKRSSRYSGSKGKMEAWD